MNSGSKVTWVQLDLPFLNGYYQDLICIGPEIHCESNTMSDQTVKFFFFSPVFWVQGRSTVVYNNQPDIFQAWAKGID